jgi:hypothetical protein
MGFRRSVPWTQQPQIAVSVRPSGFLRNPRFLVLGSNPSVDFATSAATSVVGYSQSLSDKGVSASSSTSAGNTDNIAGAVCGDISGPFTLVWVGRILATSSSNYDTLIGNDGGANGADLGIYGTAGVDKDKPYFETFSGSNVQKLTPISGQVAVSQTDFQVLVGTTDTVTLSFYQNGVLVSSVATAGVLPGTNSSPWRLGARRTFINGAAQQVLLAGAFSGSRSADEIYRFTQNIWADFSPLTRQLPALTGTISRPGTDVAVTGWTFTAASLAASINEATFSDASYGEAPFSAGSAITTLDLALAPGSYTISFRGEYLVATAASGQFRFTALDGSNTSLGVSSWQAVTSTVAQYDVPITVAGGTAVRLKIEIQA